MLLIRHTGIYVNDLERMREFYCNYFQMEVAVHDTEEGSYIDTILGIPSVSIELYKLRRNDGTMIELLKPNVPGFEDDDVHAESVISLGCMHLAFTVQNLDELYRSMKAVGILFISEPVVSPDKKAYVCFCRDPEGNFLELVEELQ